MSALGSLDCISTRTGTAICGVDWAMELGTGASYLNFTLALRGVSIRGLDQAIDVDEL